MAAIRAHHARWSQTAWQRGLRGKDVIPEYDKSNAVTWSGRRYIIASRCYIMIWRAGPDGGRH